MKFFIIWNFNYNGMVFSENVNMLELLDRLVDDAITITEIYKVDEGGNSTRRDEIDPDDLTDYGYWHRNRPKKSWKHPGYGDDD